MLRRLTEPQSEPLTLQQAKDHLRVVLTAEDTYITRLIKVARQQCEAVLNRTLITSDWELTLDYFPDAIQLRKPRVQGLVSLTYLDADGATQTLDPAKVYLDTKSEPGWLVPAPNVAWPTTLDSVNAITVTYRCGYQDATEVPEPIKQWMLIYIGTLFENREETVATPGVSQVVLDYVRHLLDGYVVFD